MSIRRALVASVLLATLCSCGKPYSVHIPNAEGKSFRTGEFRFQFSAMAWKDHYADVTLRIDNHSKKTATYDTRQIRVVTHGTNWSVGPWSASCKLQPRRPYIGVRLQDGHTLLVKEWSKNEVTARLEVPRAEAQSRDRIEIDFGSVEFEGQELTIGRVEFTR